MAVILPPASGSVFLGGTSFFMYYEDIKYQEHKTAEGYYIDVDPGMTLHYITLCYNMFLIFIYYQNHTIGV